jgi:hypothetical protein
MMPVYRVRRFQDDRLLWERFGVTKSKFGATLGDVRSTNRYREQHGPAGVKDRVTLEVIMIPEDLWELIEEA